MYTKWRSMTSSQVQGTDLMLPTGKMPMVGLGCFFGLGEISEEDVQKCIETAIDLGYRCFDTAFIYFTEKPLGQAIQNKIKERVITREDVFVISKLGFDRHHPDEVKSSVKESLCNLGLDYVDQFLIHWPSATEKASSLDSFFPELMSGKLAMYEDTDYMTVWKILEECMNDGLLKSIGLSNFNEQQVQNILDNCSIKPSVHHCEINPYHQNLELTRFCEERGIAMVAYTPLGNVHTSVAPDDWHSPLKDPLVLELAEKYNKTVAQIALRFTVQRGIPVVPNTKNPDRLAENLKIFDFEISPKDMDRLQTLERNQKFWKMEIMSKHKDYPLRTD